MLDGTSVSVDACDKRRLYFLAINRATPSACPVRNLVTTPTAIYRLSKLFVNTIIWKDVIFEVIVTAVIGQNSNIMLLAFSNVTGPKIIPYLLHGAESFLRS